ncbi:cell cycle regulator of non-homologous end joining [Ranitomeya imitator]|uniref:cell cycle regulator of non-homologous end joining n=1 Tax=Ranitomeya imitator TaxID=111125 RepID=UPI0037E7B42F
MDAAGSAVKRRLLPSWMTDDNSAPKKPHSAEPRRRKTQVSVSSRKRTVYCMNERELVECALEVLSQSKVQREEEKSKNEAASPSAGREETPPTAAGSEKPRTKPPSCNDSDDPDDDPLKYVREIFFS